MTIDATGCQIASSMTGYRMEMIGERLSKRRPSEHGQEAEGCDGYSRSRQKSRLGQLENRQHTSVVLNR